MEIREYIESKKEEMLSKLVTLVNMEGQTEEKERLERVRDWLQAEFEAEGFECSVHEVAPDRAGLLYGVLGKDRPDKPVLLSGHFDTVFPSGTFNGLNPCRVEDGLVYGPGVCDMKGGIITALYVVKALNAIGYDRRPLRLVLVGDEEYDHEGNDCDKLITELSRGAAAAFNFECAELDNSLQTGQKQQINYRVSISGVGGHAGNEFYTSKNALHEAIYKLSEIIKLTDPVKDTTVTASVINAGHNSTSVPDHCSFTVDVRANGKAEVERILSSMEEILGKDFIEGTRTEYSYFMSKMHSYTETEEISRLHGYVSSVAVRLGYPPFGKILHGGVTDAGNIAAAGVPVLCGCGLKGAWYHSTKEYAVLSSMYERAIIFAQAIKEME